MLRSRVQVSVEAFPNQKLFNYLLLRKNMEQEIKINAREVMIKLAKLQSDVLYIKEHIEDINLSENDLKTIEEYEKEKKEGKLISHKELKKELGL